MNDKIENIVVLLLRWFLGVVFIYAAVGKILDPITFAGQIDNYRILSYIFISPLATILPWVELLCGLLLIIGHWLRGASLLTVAMNLVFIIAIASAMIRGLDIDCGCFSLRAQGSQVGLRRIVEDVVFLAAATLIWRYETGKENRGKN